MLLSESAAMKVIHTTSHQLSDNSERTILITAGLTHFSCENLVRFPITYPHALEMAS